ncbi:MAG: hypothetical protein ACYC91_10485 [Solirubrobacteraceae bacterium]
MSDRSVAPDTALACRIEAQAVEAWSSPVQRRTDDGWLLRTAPGSIGAARTTRIPPIAGSPRRRSPERRSPGDRARAKFAGEHGIPAGIQVSPLSLHRPLAPERDRRGWVSKLDVAVMHGSTSDLAATAGCESKRDGRFA